MNGQNEGGSETWSRTINNNVKRKWYCTLSLETTISQT